MMLLTQNRTLTRSYGGYTLPPFFVFYVINIDECRKGSINKVALGGHYDFTTKVSLCKLTRVDENNFKERYRYGRLP